MARDVTHFGKKCENTGDPSDVDITAIVILDFLPYGKMIDDVIIGGPLKMKTVPYLEIPTAPGIGVELDRDKLALYHSFYQKEIYEKGYERETERPYYTAMFMRPYFKDILD